MALKKAAWLKELNKHGCSHQCQSCPQHHAQSCSPQEHCNIDTGHTQEAPATERGSPTIATANPTSWLPAILRRQKQNVGDVEASAESPNETTRLITPLTDDDTPPGTSTDGDGGNEQSIEHVESSEVMIKKRAKKGSKKTVGVDARGAEDIDQDILEQVRAYEGRLPRAAQDG
jgi:hypothetical protein